MARIKEIKVHYVTRGGKEKVIDLDEIRRHCRPERVEDLIGDATLLCEEVDAGRRPEDPGRMLSAVPDV